MAEKQVVGFTPRFAKRTAAAVRAFENDPVREAPTLSSGVPWTYGQVRAASTSTISGGTFNSPGSGSARIFHKGPSGWEQEAEDVTCHHDLSTASIASNTALRLDWISGEWWVAEAACQAESSPIVAED